MSVASSNFLINDPKYSFLKDLGLKDTNPGVFDGKWKGSGKVVFFCILNKCILIIFSIISKKKILNHQEYKRFYFLIVNSRKILYTMQSGRI